MEILEQIKQDVYHGRITREQVYEAVNDALLDIEKDVQEKCEHNFQYQAGGYGYDKCIKCGKWKV